MVECAAGETRAKSASGVGMRSGRKRKGCGWNCPLAFETQGAELEVLKGRLVEAKASAAAAAAEQERMEAPAGHGIDRPGPYGNGAFRRSRSRQRT